MLLIGLEPVIYPPEHVSIERVKQSIVDSCCRRPSKKQILRYAAFNISMPTDFRLLPLFNSEEDRLREISSYSMSTNKFLDCNWKKYVASLRTSDPVVLERPTIAMFNHKPKPPMDIRQKLTFIPKVAANGQMNPSPTAPKPVKRMPKKQPKSDKACCEAC